MSKFRLLPFALPTSPREGFISIQLCMSGVAHFHLDGTLNGVAIEILLDTGVGSTVIDKQFAERIGLTLTPIAAKGGDAGAASLSTWSVTGARLETGSMRLDDVQILAMDFANMRAALAAKGISAPTMKLGADVLRSRAAVID